MRIMLSLTALLLSAAGPAFADAVKPARGNDVSGLHQVALRYIDADGQFAGRVLFVGTPAYPGTQAYAIMKIGGVLAAVPTTPWYSPARTLDYTKADIQPAVSLEHATSDCSGPAYQRYDPTLFGIPRATVVRHADQRMWAYVVESAEEVEINSSAWGPGFHYCERSGGTGFRLSTSIEITGQFRPPFSIR